LKWIPRTHSFHFATPKSIDTSNIKQKQNKTTTAKNGEFFKKTMLTITHK